ncbi:probable serine/threonine-protein kinase PBL28 [Diospyros lotus]|uniref:probable serine/threonine-protein kinase PBL28 n=1 Tax=Diospyros lotus TaxID=55363 RepID=UPI002255D6B8|nr:probable serine/threonine-protein kinase PBL28 [Diospyros lotus]XP_052172338.1 probable serine/threonine-protein kinase PBL28 [Diospyros lotus]XP_052172339.1 probable serine/threonine-protein kinase PBL28 [Diospyros lotus]
MPFGLVSAWNKRRRSKSEDHIDPWIFKPVECWQLDDQNPPAKRRHGSSVFTLKEMEEATNSFREENLVGKGGFGRVYRGTLRSGEVVAIKKMDLPPFKKADGEREFRVEVDILSRLEHPNLVSLIGYCADGKHRFLVYEFMHKGNLQDHLNGIAERKMDWPLRLKVAIGAARGLAYLHSGSAVGIPIVHRDFKSTNILLSSNFEAKISDFGLAKLMPEGQEIYVTARVLGTFGYFDPEYTSTGKLTLQSDVYAFGVVLLELLTGRRAVDLNQGPNDQNLVLQVRHILNDKKKLRKVIDPEMSKSSYTMESVAMFANLASRCVRTESSERPSMAECVKELQLIFCTNSKGLGMSMNTFRMV